MIEPSLRNLPPPVPSREVTYRAQQLHHGHHHYHNIEAQQGHMERTGGCMVILPFSRSAFRNSQSGTGKCECDSFFMSPGDPGACLCGHPANCHSPRPAGSENSSIESSPSIPPINHAYIGPPPPRPPSPCDHNQTCGDQVTEKADTGSLHNRLTKLERLLASEIYARHHLENNSRFLYTSFRRLSEHCRLLSQEVELIITKSGEAARDALNLEVLSHRQKKMAEDIEKINAAVEGLDERTEDLEFRNEDLEKWVEEEKEERKRRARDGTCACPEGGVQRERRVGEETTINDEGKSTTPAISPLPTIKTLPTPPSPPLKRKRTFSDVGFVRTYPASPSRSNSVHCEDSGQFRLTNSVKRHRY